MRLYPTKKQENTLDFFLKSFNLTVQCFQKMNEIFYKKHNRYLSIQEMKHSLLKVKNKYPRLQNTNEQILEFAIKHVFLEQKQKNSTIKRKKDSHSLICYHSFFIDFKNKRLSIPGISSIKFRDKRVISTISLIEIKKYDDAWYMLLSSFIETKKEEKKKDLRFVGIDVGLKEFAILSSGQIVANPRFFRRYENKLAIEKRKLSRKKKGSENYKKQQKKVRKVYQKIAQSRMNFLHRVSSAIVNHFDVIGIEKLEIKKMVKNRQFSKSILDASWGEFVDMLKYKAKAQNKIVIEVGRFYPSSQICSNCGSKQIMPLHLRTFQCRHCKKEIDRDYNASKNIENLVRKIHEKKRT